MSLYADILRGEYADDDDVRQDGETWTVCCWLIEPETIPGFPSKEMAMAVLRAISHAYDRGAEISGYS